MYGATEASARLTYLDPERFSDKMGSIGKPIPGVSLSVIDAKAREVPPVKTGEIVATGANIMLGYWKDPGATAKVLDENGTIQAILDTAIMTAIISCQAGRITC